MKLLTGAVCDDPVYIQPNEESLIKSRKALRKKLAHVRASGEVPVTAVTKEIVFVVFSSAALIATICAVIAWAG